MSRQLEYQRRKKAAGLCTICGHRELATGTRCAPCAAVDRERDDVLTPLAARGGCDAWRITSEMIARSRAFCARLEGRAP